MDVGFISNVIYPFVTGGAQKRIHEIGSRLAGDGHDVTVYGRRFWDGPAEVERDGMTLRAAAPARKLYTDHEGRRSITEAIDFSLRLLPTLRRHVDEHDVVVASVFPYFPVLTSKASTLFRETPLVTTWHEVWGTYWNDYLGRLAPFGKAVEGTTAKLPQHPIAVSGVTADRLAAIGPTRERIEIIPNGIDVDRIESIEPASDGFDVLFAGRLIADKHVDVLLEAFDAVADDHDATLGIIGDGPESDRLKRQATELRNADRVRLLGFLDEYDDVISHMQAASVFASPSTREGFGITVLEAMAADCTVIAADHPESAAGEVVGDAGFLVEPTKSVLAAALDQALSGNRPEGNPVNRAAAFDWDAIAEDAEAAYQRAIDGTWSR